MTTAAAHPVPDARSGQGASRSRPALVAPPVVLGALTVLGTAGLAVWDPHTHHVPLCPFHAATGWWCPLCGGLRAVNDLTHAHLAQALTDNALLVVLLPLIVVWWAAWLVRAREGHLGAAGLGRLSSSTAVRVVAVVLVLAFTVLRNTPAGVLLAPTA